MVCMNILGFCFCMVWSSIKCCWCDWTLPAIRTCSYGFRAIFSFAQSLSLILQFLCRSQTEPFALLVGFGICLEFALFYRIIYVIRRTIQNSLDGHSVTTSNSLHSPWPAPCQGSPQWHMCGDVFHSPLTLRCSMLTFISIYGVY